MVFAAECSMSLRLAPRLAFRFLECQPHTTSTSITRSRYDRVRSNGLDIPFSSYCDCRYNTIYGRDNSHKMLVETFIRWQKPESGIPPRYRATRRYTKVHLAFCLRFPTLIGEIGRVPLFRAGPRRYIRSWLFRLAVTAFWRALTAPWRQEGKGTQIFPRAIRTTELPSNPSPLTIRNNQIQIFQTSSTHATTAANVSQQDTNTHGTG